jgi:hypothetical protein
MLFNFATPLVLWLIAQLATNTKVGPLFAQTRRGVDLSLGIRRDVLGEKEMVKPIRCHYCFDFSKRIERLT